MEMYPVVDYFVIVEANQSHNGTPKEFLFEKNMDRYSEWLDKVIYIKVEDMPEYDNNRVFKLEYFQRSCIMRGLIGIAKPEDKILVSDCDEIPNVEALMANLNNPLVQTFKMTLFYYYVNNACLGSWCGTTMGTYAQLNGRPQSFRWFSIKNRYQRHLPCVIRNGGWHYSYMTGGDAEKIREKISLFAEKNLLEIAGSKEDVEFKINNSKDLYGRDTRGRHKQKFVDITNNQPKSLARFLEKYPSFIYTMKP